MKRTLLTALVLTALVHIADAALQVRNGIASNVTASAAYLFGEVVATNAENPQMVLYYGSGDGSTNSASWASSNVFGAQGVGTFSTNVTGLSGNTIYYYRWRGMEAATNVAWAAATSNFTTLANAPTGFPTVTPPVYVAMMIRTNGAAAVPVGPAAFRAANGIPSTGDVAQVEADLLSISQRVDLVEQDIAGLGGTQALHTASIAALQGLVVTNLADLADVVTNGAVNGYGVTWSNGVFHIKPQQAAGGAATNATLLVLDGTNQAGSLTLHTDDFYKSGGQLRAAGSSFGSSIDSNEINWASMPSGLQDGDDTGAASGSSYDRDYIYAESAAIIEPTMGILHTNMDAYWNYDGVYLTFLALDDTNAEEFGPQTFLTPTNWTGDITVSGLHFGASTGQAAYVVWYKQNNGAVATNVATVNFDVTSLIPTNLNSFADTLTIPDAQADAPFHYWLTRDPDGSGLLTGDLYLRMMFLDFHTQ